MQFPVGLSQSQQTSQKEWKKFCINKYPPMLWTVTNVYNRRKLLRQLQIGFQEECSLQDAHEGMREENETTDVVPAALLDLSKAFVAAYPPSLRA